MKQFRSTPALAGSIAFLLSFLLPVFGGQASGQLPLFIIGAITVAGVLISLAMAGKKG